MLESRTWAYYYEAFVWPHVAYKAFNFYFMLSFFSWDMAEEALISVIVLEVLEDEENARQSGGIPGNGWEEGSNKGFTITLSRN